MPHTDDDVERAPPPEYSESTEHTPLLKGAHPAPATQNGGASSEDSTLLSDDRQDEPEEQPTRPPRTTSWYVWRAFWTILAALVLAVFIKGWIEADDVNVRNPPTRPSLGRRIGFVWQPMGKSLTRHYNYSLTWERHSNVPSAAD
jgi:hypothetical protein